MTQILNLALPFFGLIFIGFLCGKLKKLPDAGLAWMNFFIVYVSLPALFFRILARTPFEQLARIDFVVATSLATSVAFAVAFLIGFIRRRSISQATMAAVAGGFGNVGYMGPGLALATLGPAAAAPVALIFSFDALLVFAMVPTLMACGDASSKEIGRAVGQAVRGIVLNPLLISAALGVLAAAFRIELPVAAERLLDFLYTAAAPCALFALGVTVALRPLTRLPMEVPLLVFVKLALHPVLVLLLLPLMGDFGEVWVSTAVLMAALPPALTAYVFARQYNAWIEEASGAVLAGTIASIGTLTFVMWLVQSKSIAHLLWR